VTPVRRSRTLPASPDELWAIVGDAHHLPRWWPRVKRVETVDDDGFTEVLETAQGKPVRADFRVVSSSAPSVRRWAQQVTGTPFERILARAETEVRLEPEGEATRVALSLEQRPRGIALLGSFMVRAAARRQLEEALDGLEALVGARGSSSSPASSSSRRSSRRSRSRSPR
jgi:carbon monoxide dehydrogenase subunit G